MSRALITAEEYARDVLAGTIPTCRWVRLACERHLRDLESGPERGLHFDPGAAAMVLAFFSQLKHSKGEWAGQPFRLEPWQQFILWVLFGWKREDGMRRFRTSYLEVARKNGKTSLAAGIGLYLLLADGEPGAEIYSAAPLDVETLIPTPNGWTQMGAVKEGDCVFDETGKPCLVTYVSPVISGRPCYEITFSDGTSVISDAEHRWQTEVYSSGRSLRGRRRADFALTRSGGRTTAIYTTEEIRNSLTYECRGRSTTNHRIPIAGALQLPARDLPIGPYTLGAWLGDGRNNRGAIVVHPDDAMIARQIEAEGYNLSRQSDDHLLRFTVLGLRTALGEMGLLDNKHIPALYLRASVQQRMALLHGLMDTDGCCSRTGECTFTNRNERLARDIMELITSLGMLPHMRTLTVTGKPHYKVSFKAYADRPVFGLLRKASRQRPVPDARAGNRYIVAVNSVPSRPVRCISVDSPSHLYLVTAGMVATHNTKRDQARLSHAEATRMAKASAPIRQMVRIFKDNIHIPDTASKFEPLGADSDTMDGLNVHAALVDEVHAHKTRDTWDVLETGTGARRQPLMFAITTAGFDRQSLCWQLHEYTEKVLDGIIQDDTFFGVIYGIDEEDDWRDERTWIKANPNLGISKKLDDLQRKAQRAGEMPSALNAFLRLELDVWTQSETKWMNMEHWRQCGQAVDAAGLRGRVCYAGLDLSSTTDITALLLVFPAEVDDDLVQVLCRFWIPEESMHERVHRDRVPYDVWVRQGYITATPGNVVDYAYVLAQIDEDMQAYGLDEIAFDRWGATKIQTDLTELGGPDFMVQFGQGFASMSGPMKELEKLVLQHRLAHGNNPVLTWMADNLVAREDPAGNIKPDKEKSREKIDGMVALIMGLDRALRHTGGGRSIYEDRGLEVV